MIQAAKEWQRSPDFDDYRQQRQVVEHRIARMVQLGARQARYFGRRKTLFQVLMAAGANLTLVLIKTGGLETPTGPLGSLHQALRVLVAAACRAPTSQLLVRSARTNPLAVTRTSLAPHLPVLRMAASRPGF